jgi:hypothetical protein
MGCVRPQEGFKRLELDEELGPLGRTDLDSYALMYRVSTALISWVMLTKAW